MFNLIDVNYSKIPSEGRRPIFVVVNQSVGAYVGHRIPCAYFSSCIYLFVSIHSIICLLMCLGVCLKVAGFIFNSESGIPTQKGAISTPPPNLETRFSLTISLHKCFYGFTS